ncbi:acyl-coenzyme A thioesterase 13 [Bombyx mori]|uniref:Thioesterase domain-containing protein n=1 Tax=Bombyx mori TaxID=7091 RepID=A0A8R2ANC0_BOMMO|nr:acyl-coenzyme A thioesterase 13 [Bombyx mori]
MTYSARGTRLLKALENYCNGNKAHYSDSRMVFSKLKTAHLTEGCLKGSFVVDPSMCNIGDTLHGGYMASVMDAVSLYALISRSDGRLGWTTNMNISYLKPARLGDTITVESNLLKGGASSVMEVILHDGEGAPVAKSTTSFISGSDKFQKILKDNLDFDVFEN